MEFHEKVREVIVKAVEENNLELVELQQKRLPRGWLIRVFIDKEEGVTIDDCQTASSAISAGLGVSTSLIPGSYTLEVSSPGLDRPLCSERDFLRNKERTIKLSFYDSGNEVRFAEGRIKDFREGVLFIMKKGEEQAIPLEKIIKANLKVEI